jgi:2-hydroxy-3-keto-5-methylthiopentenyl-1-phosphate phosphatase
MAGQVAMLDASREELDAHLAGLRIDPAFPAFVDAVAAAGMAFCVVSDGLDYAIQAILRRHGLDGLPVRANHLIQTGERSWKLETPFADANCRVKSGHCKCVGAVRAHDRHRRVLLIGDGASDFCAAGEADFVFAKHRLIEHCRHADIPHVSIVGFEDALSMLPALLTGELHTPRSVPVLTPVS